MLLDLPPERRPRRPSLTPMIDVVFLLLVFFMLASRFGVDRELPIGAAGGPGGGWEGPPRLVTIEADALRLNGAAISPEALGPELARLSPTPTATVILRPADDATAERLVAIMDALRAAGDWTLVLAE